MICFDDIGNENYVEFSLEAGGPWHPALFCESCVKSLQASQFEAYKSQVANSTCAKETRLLLERGPPSESGL